MCAKDPETAVPFSGRAAIDAQSTTVASLLEAKAGLAILLLEG